MAETLRVILGIDSALKLSLPCGIPDSVDELKAEIQRHFGLSGDFRLQYKDIEFDDFLNLTCTSEIKDKGTVKVIYLPSGSGTCPLQTATCHGLDDSSSFSSTADTDIRSSPQSTSSGSSSLRSQPWPKTFQIPQFSYEVQIQLEKANNAFNNSGTLLNPSTKLKSDILEGLASEIVRYKTYPSSAEFDDVAQALITKYPCLKEQGSVTGYYGWKISLKYKMANYRTRLRNIGCPELSINSVKGKRGDTSQCPNQVKKPRKAEVNYCPDYPAGETKESLEEERKALVLEVNKKYPQLIKNKMERTFAYRRQEVVKDTPFIAQFRDRWPALFSVREVNAEFTRITTVPLLSTFLSQLDYYTDKLMGVFRKKGGTVGCSISLIMAAMDKNPSIETRRECLLKGLCCYLNEKPESLIKEFLDVDPGAKREMEEMVLGIYVIRNDGAEVTDPPEDIGIIIEGVEVLGDLGDVASGCAVLLGLIYSLNLSYPKDLRYTFEFIQKVLMQLDSSKLSNKVQVLKNKLHE